MERERIVEGIRAAFAGVTLGTGASLRQAQASDRAGDGPLEAGYDALPQGEVTDDWSLVPEEELRRDCIGFLDDEGLRYYLPAFMLWLLDNYDDEALFGDPDWDMARIGTLLVIAPPKDFRERQYAQFDGWAPEQRAAMAAYVEALPRLVELQHEDATRVERAIRDYWERFLPQG